MSMIADMAKRGEVSEIEHFATLIMGELHVVNDKIDTLSADTKSEFIKIREEIFDVRREVLDVRGELREVRKDVDFLVEQKAF